jgi:transcriptional regulator with XRE-family HTH domain
MRFRARLEQELAERRAKNSRYSLRAFAAFLGADHSTLSQILRGTRPVPVGRIRAWGKKLEMPAEEIAVYIAAEHAPDPADAGREEQLRHWTAEALQIVANRTHFEIVRLARTTEFRADSRWIARQVGVAVDEVNLAVSRLMRLRLLEASAAGKWMERTGIARLTECDFRKLALGRVREQAAEAHVVLIEKGPTHHGKSSR